MSDGVKMSALSKFEMAEKLYEELGFNKREANGQSDKSDQNQENLNKSLAADFES